MEGLMVTVSLKATLGHILDPHFFPFRGKAWVPNGLVTLTRSMPREAYSCDINPEQGGSESELQTGDIYHGEDLGLFIFGDLRLMAIGFQGTYPL